MDQYETIILSIADNHGCVHYIPRVVQKPGPIDATNNWRLISKYVERAFIKKEESWFKFVLEGRKL